MAPTSFLSTEALVALSVPVSALPMDLRIFDAESAVEAAEAIWQMRARDLEAAPSESTLRAARWAGEDLREALDHLEALRVGA